MLSLPYLYNSLQELGIRFFTGVPDSLLNDFCLFLEKNVSNRYHVMAANEGNAIGIAVGHYLATGEIPLVYMQNSGIGNATNPLLSLAHKTVYSVPMILLIGWRGDPSVSDHSQHKKQGELTPVLMSDMDIPFEILDSDHTVIDKFRWALTTTRKMESPVALIVKKGILSNSIKKQVYPNSNLMSREEAISAVLDMMGDSAIYLATTGRATRELHEQIELHGLSHGTEFLNVGAMGHLSSIGLGMALGCKERRIVVFDGDAAAIMHMGSFATNGRYHPENLMHIVLNNGVNESVGGQKSAGQYVNLTSIANSCGYKTVSKAINSIGELKDAVKSLSQMHQLCFLDIHIRQGIRKDIPMLNINHINQKKKLMDTMKGL